MKTQVSSAAAGGEGKEAVRYDEQGFSCCRLLLDEDQLPSLRSDCKKAFQLKECEEGERYSSGQTFWVGAEDEPRCELERLAAGIFRLHTQGMSYDPSTSGAEWWTQYIDNIDDIGFHFDRDYGLEEEGELCHPHLGSVTYLSSIGGATVVLDMPGKDYPATPDNLIDCSLNRCVVSRPVVGKHITFNGLMLHGAPSDLYEIESEGSEDEEEEESDEDTPSGPQNCRITFLVNMWVNHIPSQAARLGKDFAATMENPRDDDFISCVRCEPYPDDFSKEVSLDKGSTHVSQWDIDIEDYNCTIQMELPSRDRLEDAFTGSTHTAVVKLCEGSSFVRSKSIGVSSMPSKSRGRDLDSSGIDENESKKQRVLNK